MTERWLIIADDLTGAADSAVPFARGGLGTRVVWSEAGDPPGADVISFDADSRVAPASEAARRHAQVLHRWRAEDRWLFKKVDSTLRGHYGEEIRGLLDVRIGAGQSLGVFASAYPALGRALRDGCLWVKGVAARTSEGGELRPARQLEKSGVRVEQVPLEMVRLGPDGLAAALTAILRRGAPEGSVAVCDADTQQDLECIAVAGRRLGPACFFIGSGGLAHALAPRPAAPRPQLACARSNRGTLFVVGSRAYDTRVGLEKLQRRADLHHETFDRADLDAGMDPARHAVAAKRMAAALDAGQDVLVSIASQRAGAELVEYGFFPWLVKSLARVLAPVATHAGALAATGGDTAAALLRELNIDGIQLVDEIEPGIPIGLTLGALAVPVITKAGGFGEPESMIRIVETLRRSRQTGVVP